MANRQVTLTGIQVGGNISFVDIYHTSTAPSNIVASNVSRNDLINGYTFTDDDSHNFYIIVSDEPCDVEAYVNLSTDELVLQMGVDYSSGSTIANYSFTASTQLTESTTVNFTNTIYDINNNPIDIISAVTINAGSRIGSTRVVLDRLDYSDVRGYETVFKDISSEGQTFETYDKTSSIVYEDKPTPIWTPYTFRGCCPKDGSVVGYVTQDAISVGGWVANGGGIIHQGKCYVPSQIGGSNPVQYFYGAEIKTCSDKSCPSCPSPTPTPTVSLTPSYCHDGLDCYTECCFLDMFECVIPDPTPTPSSTVTPTVTPSITATPSITPSITATPSVTPSITATPSITPSITATPTISPSVTATPTITPTITTTPSVSVTNTPTPSLTPTLTPTPTTEPINVQVRTCCEELSWEMTIHPDAAFVGNTVLVGNICYQILSLGGSGSDGDLGNPSTVFDQCDACLSCIGDTSCSGTVSGKATLCGSGQSTQLTWTSSIAQSPCVGSSFTYDGLCWEVINISSGLASGAVSVTFDGCC